MGTRTSARARVANERKGGDELNVLWISRRLGPMAFLDRSHEARVSRFIDLHLSIPREQRKLSVLPLRGGLVTDSVLRVRVNTLAQLPTSRRNFSFVVKALRGTCVREAAIYEALSQVAPGLAPRLYAVDRHRGRTLLFLDSVRHRPWPWKSLQLARRVLERLARFHEKSIPLQHTDEWDYDAELKEVARHTFDQARSFVKVTDDALVRSTLPALRRLIDKLPDVRSGLLHDVRLPATLIHGDLHPGNVLMAAEMHMLEPVFVDWARARMGSPLEDVSSWIEWLGFWEPIAKQKHDTLFAAYLSARGLKSLADRSLRDAYWTAAAINCCSGALSHFLDLVLKSRRATGRHTMALRAVHHCARMVRRADRATTQFT